MTAKSEICLQNFYVYNSSYGQREGEELKNILYYYPPETDFDTQMKNVGLSEAIIKFTDTFNPDQTCESLHTQKSKQLYYQPERGFWMAMTVSIPCVSKMKDGTEYLEYQSDDVQDSVYLAVLQQSYQMFRLFKGSFTSILDSKGGDVGHLRQKLDRFFSRYLLTLKLNHCDILDVFQGIQFLPLDKQTFLRVQCFVNLIEAMFAQVKYTAFLYNDQLVWSGIEPGDMQVVYRYLVTSLLPAHMETELQGGSMPRHPTSYSSSHYGRFVTGPANLQDVAANVGKVPKVFINNLTSPEVYHLVVYRALSATVCLFVDGSLILNIDLFKRLDVFLGPHLTSLVSEVAEQCGKQAANSGSSSPDPNSPKYVYFNQLNLAQKSTVHLDSRKTGNICVTSEVLRLLADINADKTRMPATGETILKTMSDYWVIGKLSNLREFYAIIQQKNANLIGIDDEVKRFCDNQLKNIFFHD